MNRIAASLILLFGCLCGCKSSSPDPFKTGSHTHLLSYSLAYKAHGDGQEATLTATLRNLSGKNIKVQVNDKKFHAAVTIIPQTGDPYTAYTNEYSDLLTTAIWEDPIIPMAPEEAIIWIVPIGTLFYSGDHKLDHDSLRGCEVVSEMNMAIVPPDGDYIGSNAAQKSAVVYIKNEE
jgi:hypothetical protein